MNRTILTFLILSSAAACAKNPDSIAPVPMDAAYQNISCKQAYTMLPSEKTRLVSLESRQRNAAAGDAVGVFLIGVPMSSVAGNDVEGELAITKGKVVALENRLMAC